MRPTIMSKLLIGLFVAAGLLVSSANALDLGKELSNMAKEKMEEAVLGKDSAKEKPAEVVEEKAAEKPAETVITNPVPTSTPTVNTGAAIGTTSSPAVTTPLEAAKAEPAKPTINWKSPSREEEIALARV